MNIYEFLDNLEKINLQQKRERTEQKNDESNEEASQSPQITSSSSPSIILTIMRTNAGVSVPEKVVELNEIPVNADMSELNEDQIQMIVQGLSEQAPNEPEMSSTCNPNTEQQSPQPDKEQFQDLKNDVPLRPDDENDAESPQNDLPMQDTQNTQSQHCESQPKDDPLSYQDTSTSTQPKQDDHAARTREENRNTQKADINEFIDLLEETAKVKDKTKNKTRKKAPKCTNCGRIVDPNMSGPGRKRQFCSKQCRDQYVFKINNPGVEAKAENNMEIKICKFCGKAFETYCGNGMSIDYCSVTCAKQYLGGGN